MANQKQIKTRVKSVKNIGRITGALEMVAASKVQKAQDKALNSKPYAQKVHELVSAFEREKGLSSEFALLRSPAQIKTDLIILVTSNRGLVGSLNTLLLNKLENSLLKDTNHKFITFGTKGISFAAKFGELLADFSENAFEEEISACVELIIKEFTEEKVDAVYIAYNDFNSIMKYEPTITKLFPLSSEDFDAGEPTPKFVFEPSPEEVLKNLLTFYIETEIRDAIFEAEASEHSARMVAMKNASENANELGKALNLEYNKARQSSITTELADITTSSLTLNE